MPDEIPSWLLEPRGFYPGEGKYDPEIGAARLAVPGPRVRKGSEGGAGSVAETNVENNNLGNIKAPGGGWMSYPSRAAGIDAIGQWAERAQSRHGLKTLRQLIDDPTYGYAPSADPGNRGKNLPEAAASAMGVSPDDPINMADPSTRQKWISAILRQEQGGATGGGAPVTRTDRPGGRFADSGVAFEQGRGNTSVNYMDPADFLALLPPIETDEAGDRTKRRSLMKSLNRGDEIEAIPTVETAGSGDERRVVDYDGRHRAQAALDAGLDAIPVAFHGIDAAATPKTLKGLTDHTVPFDFTAVPNVSRETSLTEKAGRLFGELFGIPSAQAAEPLPRTMPAATPSAPAGAAIEPPAWLLEPSTGGGSAPPAWLTGTAPPRPVDPRGFQSELMPGEQIVPQGPPDPNARQPEYRPALVPFSMEGGFHPVLPQAVEAPLVGIQQSGQMMRGERPVQPTPELVAAATLGGGLPPGSRAVPQTSLADIGRPAVAPSGQGMIDAAAAARELPLFPPRPSAITPERAALAQEARDRFGIPLTASEIDPAQTLPAAAIRSIPGSGDVPRRMELQRRYNNEVARTMGEDAPAITQQVMKDAKTRIGDGLDRIESSNYVDFTPQFLSRINDIRLSARKNLTKPEYGVIKRNVDGILHHLDEEGRVGDRRSGLSGEQFGNLMHYDADLNITAENSNPNIAKYGTRLQEAMRDLLQENLSGADLAEYRALRYQYKNMKTIEPVVEKNPEGNVSPTLLNNQVSRNFRNRAYDVSGTELDRLGKIGQAFLKEPLTSDRLKQYSTLWALGKGAAAVGGLAAGHAVGLPLLHEGISALALFGGARGLTAMMARPGRAERLIDRALTRLPASPDQRRNAVNALMSERGATTLRQLAQPPGP